MYTENIAKKALVERLIKEDKITLDEGLLLLDVSGDSSINMPFVIPYPTTMPWNLQPWYQEPITVLPVDSITTINVPGVEDGITCTYVMDYPSSSPYITYTKN